MEIKSLKRELKQSISLEDYRVLKQALLCMYQDKSDMGSMQTVRKHALHFENELQQAREKSVEKFTIRYVGEDKDSIRLEKKSRKKELFLERSAAISRHDCEKILGGDPDALSGTEDPLLFEFFSGLTTGKLKPKIVVDCTRETFVFAQGKVCIAIESDFSTGLNISDFLNDKHPTIKRTGQILLEVQFEKYLPEIVSRLFDQQKEYPAARFASAHV